MTTKRLLILVTILMLLVVPNTVAESRSDYTDPPLYFVPNPAGTWSSNHTLTDLDIAEFERCIPQLLEFFDGYMIQPVIKLGETEMPAAHRVGWLCSVYDYNSEMEGLNPAGYIIAYVDDTDILVGWEPIVFWTEIEV